MSHHTHMKMPYPVQVASDLLLLQLPNLGSAKAVQDKQLEPALQR